MQQMEMWAGINFLAQKDSNNERFNNTNFEKEKERERERENKRESES